MVLSLFFFTVEICAIFFGLFYTLKTYPLVRRLVSGVCLVLLPTVLLYLHTAPWLWLIYFFISVISLFYFYTKQLRILLDVVILAIGTRFGENISQIIRFTYLEENDTILIKSALIIIIFFVLFTYLYRLFIDKTWDSNTIPIVSQLVFIIVAWITVTIFYINLFISLRDNLYYPAMFNIMIESIYFVLMFILSVILLRNVKKENSIKQKEMEREQLFQYMQSLEHVNRDMQNFRHDYKNILLTMQGYMNENDMEGLKHYFDECIMKVEENSLHHTYIYNQLDHIKLVELKGILSSKILYAEELGVQVNIEIPNLIDQVDMNIIDLTRLVGILMDNALESSSDMEDAQVNLALLKKNDSFLLILENRVDVEFMNIEKLFQAGYSTKGKNRGRGLSNVRSIVHRYPNIMMNTRVENSYFIHEIEIIKIDSMKKRDIIQ
ncbi:two-component system sensor histidine kinase AgrC [Natronobacillus azotifigens]|uniref:GHKL domain-containing protein n=1 Tax=Natronobacillus azotifigens TaxID=472978 RepID=A0A9J6RFP2_9BACI|nr:GHKL domain-containing protein [Natronobacillus azotifigens]MCZ0703977.1 GHKL domain-containing protein [Natronobacillus azotifigens]